MKSFMEWLRLKEWDDDEVSLDGEYWIDDSGNAQFADGDVGDLNHEAMAMQTLQSQISGDGDKDWDEFKQELAERIYQEKMASTNDEAGRQELTDAYEDDPESMITDEALQDEGIDAEAWKYANGFGDARDYAMEHWGWKKVLGNGVETWTFNDNDKSILANGLAEVIDQELGELDAEEAQRVVFYVHVHSTGQSFDVTIAQLEGNAWTPPQQEPEAPAAPPPPQLPQYPQVAHGQTFFNFMYNDPSTPGAMPYEDDDERMKIKPDRYNLDYHSRVGSYGTYQDRQSMPAYYKGRIGDWYIPT